MDMISKKLRILWRLVPRDHDYYEIYKGSILTFLLRLLSFVLIYVLHFVIAKYYSAEGLGIYTLAITILDIGVVLVLFGFDTSIVRYISQFRSNNNVSAENKILKQMIYFTLPLSILLSVVMWMASEKLAIGLFNSSKLILVFQVVALLIPPFVLTSLYVSAFRGRKRIVESIVLGMVSIRFINLFLLLGLIAYLGLKDSYILLSLAISVWINAILSVILWKKNSSKHLPVKDEDLSTQQPPKIKEILSVSMPLYLTASMYLIMGWTDTLMLGFYKDEKTVGIYSMVLKLSQLANFAFISINTILSPKISELFWSNQKEKLQKVILLSSKIMFWGSFPVILILSLFSEPLLGIFGEEFKVGALPLIILFISQLINGSTGSVVSLLSMTGHQVVARNVLLVACVVNIIGNLLLIPPYGIMGAAIATAAGTMVRDLLASYYSYKIFGFQTWYFPFGRFYKRLKMR